MKRQMIGFVTGLAAEARLLGNTGFMVAVGGGTPEGAARAAKQLLTGGATALISFGLAGGLSRNLANGTIIIPKAVMENARTYPCDYALIERFGGATHDLILAGKRIAATVDDKALLYRSSRAVAIDLESGAVARAAAEAGVKFAVLRVVLDSAMRNLPPAALVPLKPDGGIDLPKILASVAAKPGQLPTLLALAGDTQRARAALLKKIGEFK
jgi:adenosylhomocysteine nucleosidase